MVVVSNLSSIFDLQEIYLMEDYNLIDVKGFNLMQYKKKTLPALFENIRTQHDIDGIPPASVQAYERMVDLNEKTVTDLFQIPATHAKQALYDLFSSTSLPRYADAILAFLIDLEQRVRRITPLLLTQVNKFYRLSWFPGLS